MFVPIYYSVALFSLICIPFFFSGSSFRYFPEVRITVVTILIATYMLGMSRSSGVDMNNYRRAFEEIPGMIPDVGFQYLILALNAVKLPMIALTLFIALVNIYALIRASRYFNIEFGLLLILWFLHIAVVRDFAQMRMSLAMSFTIIGLTSEKAGLKWLAYVVAVSMHLTSIVFILAYEACRILVRIRPISAQWALLALVCTVIMAGAALVDQLAFLDGRVDIYLNRREQGYGLPVNSYGAIILNLFVLMIALATYRQWSDDLKTRTMLYLQLIGLVTFVAFLDYAIFAFRLSHVIVSLYPMFLISAVNSPGVERSWLVETMQKIGVWMLGMILFLRPDSIHIIEKIGFI